MFDWMGGLGGMDPNAPGAGPGGGMPDFSGMPSWTDMQNMPALMQNGGGGLMQDGSGGLRAATGNDYFGGAVGRAMNDMGMGQGAAAAPTDPMLGLPGGQGFRNRQGTLADGMTRLGLLSGKLGA